VRLRAWHIDLLVDLHPARVYLAYDTPDDYEPLCRAARMLKASDPRVPHGWISCYVLVGYPRDTFEAAEARLQQVKDLGLMPMAMLYRDD
jgi:hypothetical protein